MGGEPGVGLLGTVGEPDVGVAGVAPTGLLLGGEFGAFVAAGVPAGLLVNTGKPGAGVTGGLLLLEDEPGAPVVAAGVPAWLPVLAGAPGAGVTEAPAGLPLVEREPGAEVMAAGVPAGLLVTAGRAWCWCHRNACWAATTSDGRTGQRCGTGWQWADCCGSRSACWTPGGCSRCACWAASGGHGR